MRAKSVLKMMALVLKKNNCHASLSDFIALTKVVHDKKEAPDSDLLLSNTQFNFTAG